MHSESLDWKRVINIIMMITVIIVMCAGVDVERADSEGRTLLHLAVGRSARTGCACRVVERFLTLGLSPNTADSKGQTALHYAALKGVKATTQALLKVRHRSPSGIH
jgi:ankyrin repeat protein